MEIKAVATSVNYDDYLALTLPHTLRHLTDVTVLTDPHDVGTDRCRYGCQCRNYGYRRLAKNWDSRLGEVYRLHY